MSTSFGTLPSNRTLNALPSLRTNPEASGQYAQHDERRVAEHLEAPLVIGDGTRGCLRRLADWKGGPTRGRDEPVDNNSSAMGVNQAGGRALGAAASAERVRQTQLL